MILTLIGPAGSLLLIAMVADSAFVVCDRKLTLIVQFAPEAKAPLQLLVCVKSPAGVPLPGVSVTLVICRPAYPRLVTVIFWEAPCG